MRMPWLRCGSLHEGFEVQKDLEHEQPSTKPLLKDPEPAPDFPKHSGIRTPLPWFLVTFLSILLIWTSVHDGQLAGKVPNHRTRGLDCGSKPSEAVSKGCKFDMVTFAWVPAPCYDAPPNEEWRKWAHSSNVTGGGFPYYKYHHNISSRFRDEEEFSMWEGTRWTTEEEHRLHCTWMLPRLVHRALQGIRGARSLDWEHTDHCSKMGYDTVLKKQGDDAGLIDIIITPGYEKC